MSSEPTGQSKNSAPAQERFLSLFLRSERRIFASVAALVAAAAAIRTLNLNEKSPARAGSGS